MSVNILFDMDGTLARFYEEAGCLWKYKQPGFFRNLFPYRNMVEAFKLLSERSDLNCSILTSCDTEDAAKEKQEWADEHLRADRPVECVICLTSESKAEIWASRKSSAITSADILVDDYSLRCKEWTKAGGTAIKALNGLNGCGWNGHRFDGPVVSTDWSPDQICETILRCVRGLANT